MEFKVGDVVELNSGGPNMTVESRQNGDEWWCVWFNSIGPNAHEKKGSSFKGETLKRVDR
ncbi:MULTISPECIES: DUF2158 domain-containing protein [Chelativorans]|jgi:uncharacterized protein YodC (DUF2158 family)|uniref:YodC family protein n=1 Tax=Chelativorans TaxID=449972 RepID=UPI0005A1EF69